MLKVCAAIRLLMRAAIRLLMRKIGVGDVHKVVS